MVRYFPAARSIRRNDASLLGYVGRRNAGSGIHRYYFVVHALDERRLEIPPDELLPTLAG